MLKGYIFAEISSRFCHASINLYQNNIPSSKHTSHKNMKFIKSRFFLPTPIQLNDSLVLHPLNSFSSWQNSVVGFRPQVAAPDPPVHIDNGLVRRSPALLRVDNTPPVTGGHRAASDHVDLGSWGDWWFYDVEDFNVKMFKKYAKSTCSFTIVEIKLSKQQFD